MKKILLYLFVLCSLATQAQYKSVTTPSSSAPVNDDVLQRKNNKWVPRTLAQLSADLNISADFDTTTIYLGLNARVKYSDTALMLLAYRNALLARVFYSDTANMLAAYRNALLTKVNYSDTAGMLSAYRTALLARIRWTDSATLFTDYRTALLNRSVVGHTHTASDITNFQSTVSLNTDVAASVTHAGRTDNPHSVTKSQVGLSNADNTSDANKPVSTAQAVAIALKSNLAGGNTFTGNQLFSTAGTNAITVSDAASNTYPFLVTVNGFGGVGLQANWRTLIFPNDGNASIVFTTAGAIGATGTLTFSASKGSVLNSMTTTVRDAIASPVEGALIYNNITHAYNYHNGTSWGAVANPGTVTDFSAGDLSPLFTTTESNTTTTPALSFSLTNAAAHKFFGNATGSTGAPSYSSIGTGDLPDLSSIYQPLDADLTTIAGLTATTDNFMVGTSSAWASRTPTQARSQIGLGNVENTALSTWAGSTSITTLGTIGTGTWNATAIGETKGGTNQTTYTLGDLLYSSATNTLSKLAGNTTTTKKFLSQTGNATISAAPVWDVITAPDIAAAVSNTEFGYLDGVTSAIQTQIDLKSPIAAPTFTTSIQTPIVILPSQSPPAAVASSATLFSEDVSGRIMAGQVGPTGQTPYHFQPSVVDMRFAYLSWQATSTSATQLGMSVAAGSTTVTALNVTTTNLFTSVSRAEFRSSASAGSSASQFGNGTRWQLSSTAGIGGFHFIWNGGLAHPANVAQARAFVGFEPTGAIIGNVNPSTLINVIGFGFDAAGTTWNVISNDGSGTATMTDLGANFPCGSAAQGVDWYQFQLFAVPGTATSVTYKVTRVNTGDVATGTISTNLPASGTLLDWQEWVNNGTTALAVYLDNSTIAIGTKN